MQNWGEVKGKKEKNEEGEKGMKRGRLRRLKGQNFVRSGHGFVTVSSLRVGFSKRKVEKRRRE